MLGRLCWRAAGNEMRMRVTEGSPLPFLLGDAISPSLCKRISPSFPFLRGFLLLCSPQHIPIGGNPLVQLLVIFLGCLPDLRALMTPPDDAPWEVNIRQLSQTLDVRKRLSTIRYLLTFRISCLLHRCQESHSRAWHGNGFAGCPASLGQADALIPLHYLFALQEFSAMLFQSC